MHCTIQDQCRACGSESLADFLALGETPLANSLLAEDRIADDEPTYPLTMAMCSACSLVQLRQTIDPEVLFSDYAYLSSFSDAMLTHAKNLVDRVVSERNLNGEHRVIEIASNDGYLLQYYQQAGVEVLGIEPAQNIAAVAIEKGIPTRSEFFGETVANSLIQSDQQADVIHANNVMAHVPDLNGFVKGIATLLKPTGVAIIEAPHLQPLIDHVEFDTVYHEHLCYFSLTALLQLFTSHGLKVVDVEQLAIHGGSLRVTVSHSTSNEQPTPAVADLLTAEAAWGVADLARYEGFATRVNAFRDHLVEMLTTLKQDQHRIAVYGASAKGSTLLNYCGLGRETLDYVVDRSDVKQGQYTPGSHLEIREPACLASDMPEYTLLLTWNFADEILAQQQEYRERGGKFIIPLPELRVA